MTMTEERKLFWYRTHQLAKDADVWAYTNNTQFVGYETERTYEQIDKGNLIEMGYGTITLLKKDVQHD